MVCASLAACASLPARKETADLIVKIKVSEGANPDEHQRPAPVMVRLYELKSAGAFENADFSRYRATAARCWVTTRSRRMNS